MSVQVSIELARKRKQVVLSMVVKGSKLTIIFGLLSDINVMTARCSDKDKSQYVLEALYPYDAGDTWPNGKQPNQETHSMARPYRSDTSYFLCEPDSDIYSSLRHARVRGFLCLLLPTRCNATREILAH